MEKEKTYQVTNDIMFRRIFGQIGNENITKNFLECILNTKIADISLDTNKILQGQRLNNKSCIVDVKVKLEDGTKILVEMQRKRDTFIMNRILTYLYKLGLEDLNISNSYKELKKVIVILITDYKLTETEGYNKYHHVYELRDEEDDNVLSKKVQINLLELNKFKESGENTEKEEWIAFLKAKEVKDMAKIATKNDWLQKAKEEFEYLSSKLVNQQEIEERRWELRDIISMCEFHEEEGMKKGMKKGIEKGRKDEEKRLKKQIVKAMYTNNISIEEISKIVKLNKKDIEKILEN